jgi:hypothetical protein
MGRESSSSVEPADQKWCWIHQPLMLLPFMTSTLSRSAVAR